MLTLRLAHRVRETQAEGPGTRYAIWTAGCSIRCPGCCNPELFDPKSGEDHLVGDLVADVIRTAHQSPIDGITVLGGEPIDQLTAVTALCRGIQQQGLGTIVFTGYALAEAARRPGFTALWASLDTLVDGRFVASRAYRHSRLDNDEPARFLGSDNQHLYHRTPRYAELAAWRGTPSAELHIDRHGRLQAHGHPRAVARLLHVLDSNVRSAPLTP